MEVQIVQVVLYPLSVLESFFRDFEGHFVLTVDNSLLDDSVHCLILFFIVILSEVDWADLRKGFIGFLFMAIGDLHRVISFLHIKGRKEYCR